MRKILKRGACICLFCRMTCSIHFHPSVHATVLPPIFSVNISHQKHYKWPLGSIYTHLSGGPSHWGVPTAVWGETGTVVWVSWRPRSHCLSNPSAGRTWGQTGPVGMMSSARRRGPTGLGETYLHGLQQHLQRDLNSRAERANRALGSWQATVVYGWLWSDSCFPVSLRWNQPAPPTLWTHLPFLTR